MSAKFKTCVVCGREFAGAVCECLKGTPIYEAMKFSEEETAASRGESPKPSADGRQIGGDHYKKQDGVQEHWNRMWDLYREAWFVGNVTKYVERYRKKDGLKDLQKARHYLDKLIELEELDAKFKTDEGYKAWREGYIFTSHETDEDQIRKVYEETHTDPNPYVEINPSLKDGRLLCGCRGVKCEGHEDTNVGEAS